MAHIDNTITVYLHTSKLYEQANYAETFRSIVRTHVAEKAKFALVMSEGTAHFGVQTKKNILNTANALFKIVAMRIFKKKDLEILWGPGVELDSL